MIKAVVLGAHYTQFTTYIRNRKYNRNNYGYYNGGDPLMLYGLHHETPIRLLEGWQQNPNYTVNDMVWINWRFENIDFISEEKIYNEGISF
jgi:hypothetical protein